MVAGRFSRYEIRGELGKGGMAEVHRAYDPLFAREVALKILRREMIKDQKLRERFERETKILASLELEGIVPVYDVGYSEEDQLFFVMRLMTGGTLADRMQNGPLSTAQIIRIIQRMAPALDGAHAQGIIHRDLKPGNILFDGRDNAYIADFGIAKASSIVAPNTTTNSSGILGTPRYMSPEQARGESVDARSDIYSLGVIVFEMLVGKRNFDTVTPLGLAFTQETNVIHRILDTNPALPPDVQTVIEKVLARDRDLRYGSSTEFVNDLVAALSVPWPPPQEEPVREETPSRARYWVAAGILLFGLILFGIWGYPGPITPPPVSTKTATATIQPTVETRTPTATSTPTETAPPPVVSTRPPGGADRIALTANDEIYLMNENGSNFESLTKTRVPKYDLQWLPGGEKLLYIEGSCVYQIDVATDLKESEKLFCFTDPEFTGFRVSPDGRLVAISLANRLLVLPFDIEKIATAPTAFELQQLEGFCLDYSDVSVRDALWSADGKRLAIRYQSLVNDLIGDTVRVIEGNWQRCQDVSVLIWDEFPAQHFDPTGYARHPILPSFQWDGDKRFLMNTFIRNTNYGDLYLYDISTKSARKINPIEGACCYGSAAFSPDGTHLLVVFQDQRRAPDNTTELYYIPIDQIGTVEEFTPLPLPVIFFQDWRENIQLALHPSP